MEDLGKLLIVFGGLIILIGGALLLAGRLPFRGRLPGDLTISGSGWTCFIPLATSILLSLILTILLNVVLALFRR